MMKMPAGGPTLTPTERLAFDIRGYAVVPGVLEPDAIKAVNAELDAIEAVGLRCRDALPDAPGVRYESRYERLGATWPDQGEGARAGIGLGDSGSKIWAYGAAHVAPSLPLLAESAVAGPAILPYLKEFHLEPCLEMFAPRFQWQGAESDIHDSRSAYSAGFQRTLASGDKDMKGEPMNGMPTAENFSTTEGGRLQMEQFRVMVMLTDVEPGDGALMVIPGESSCPAATHEPAS